MKLKINMKSIYLARNDLFEVESIIRKMDRVEAKYVRKKKPRVSGSGSEGNDVANFDLDERCIATLANREQFITICEMCSPRVARWCVCMYVCMYVCVCMYACM
jgi:hypothetical protein